MSCNCNTLPTTSCECQSCENNDSSCLCPIKDLSTDCILFTGSALTCSGIETNTVLTDLLVQLDQFVCNKFEEVVNYFALTNIGDGAEVYKGIAGTGEKELRTIISEDINLLDIVENADTISVRAGLPSIELDSNTDILSLIMTTLAGATTLSTVNLSDYNLNTFIQGAVFDNNTQILTITRNNSEPDITVDFSFLNNHLETVSFNNTTNNLEFQLTDSTILTVNKNDFISVASETEQGIAEIATQAEVDAGTDDEKIITPAKLANYTFSSVNLPNSTETQRGIAEIATQAEVDAGTDDEKIITPAKLNSNLNVAITNYLNSANINPIRNIGTISPVNPGFGNINSQFTVSGNITSAVLEAISASNSTILVTIQNAMDNTNYVVKSFHESLGGLDADDNLSVCAFKPVSTTQFRISVSAPAGEVQSIRMHLDVEQR